MRWLSLTYLAVSWHRAQKFHAPKLAMESLEDRRCLVSDIDLTLPTELLPLGDAPPSLSNSAQEVGQAESGNPLDPVGDIHSNCRQSDWIDDVMSQIENCNELDPADSDAFEETSDDDDRGDVSEEPPEVDDRDSDSVNENEEHLEEETSEFPSTDYNFGGISTIARESDLATNLMASGIEATEYPPQIELNQQSENTPVPRMEAVIAKSDPRPVIQPVETLQFTAPQWHLRPEGSQAAGDARCLSQASALGKTEPTDFSTTLGTQLKSELFAVSTSYQPEKPEITRPNISAVVVLMPEWESKRKFAEMESPTPDGPKVTNTPKKSELDLPADALLVKLLNHSDFAFPAKTREKEDSQVETTDKALNPLCFVVLVGLVGLPQSWRNKIVRSVLARDTRKSSRPITVVPLEKQLEPWRDTTFANRDQDETT